MSHIKFFAKPLQFVQKLRGSESAVYISRAGMETKQLDERFAQTELNTVKSRIDKERIRQRESGMGDGSESEGKSPAF